MVMYNYKFKNGVIENDNAALYELKRLSLNDLFYEWNTYVDAVNSQYVKIISDHLAKGKDVFVLVAHCSTTIPIAVSDCEEELRILADIHGLSLSKYNVFK